MMKSGPDRPGGCCNLRQGGRVMTPTTTSAGEPVVVYQSNDPLDAAMIRNTLTAEGIPCHLDGEQQGGFAHLISEVTVMVPADRAEEARRVIEQMELATPEEST